MSHISCFLLVLPFLSSSHLFSFSFCSSLLFLSHLFFSSYLILLIYYFLLCLISSMFVSSHLFSSFRISTCLILFPFSSLPPDCSHLSLFHSFTGSDEWSSALWESRCCAIHILSEKVVCAGVSARRVCVSVCLFLWVNLIKPAYCLLTDIFHTISHRRVSVRLFCNS